MIAILKILLKCNLQFPCGHRCKSNCHSGSCPNPEQCKKKVKVFCACKRIKKEFSCETVRNGKAEVPCDETCNEKKLANERVEKSEKDKRLLEEKIKNEKELEKYEKLFHGKKKNKEKRTKEDVIEKSLLERYWMLFTMLCLGISVLLYSLL